MKLILILFSFFLGIGRFVYGGASDAVFIEESVKSKGGEDILQMRELKPGELYRTIETPAKIFVGDKVGGSLEGFIENPTLERKKSEKIDLILNTGTLRIRAQKLDTDFSVKTPGCVIGVRGTHFKLVATEGKTDVVLPEGKLELTANDKKQVLNAEEKVAAFADHFGETGKMTQDEVATEMREIVSATRFRNIKLEKAVDEYQQKVQKSKLEMENKMNDEKSKLEQEIDKEIEKSKTKGDLDSIDKLQKLKEGFDQESSIKSIEIRRKSYVSKREKLMEGHDGIVTKESEKLSVLFDAEIREATKKDDLGYAREMKEWKARIKLPEVISNEEKTRYVKGGKKFGKSVYKAFFVDNLTWDAAKKQCEAMGGHLAIINSKEENDFVFSLTNKLDMWAGIYFDKQKNKWVWVDGRNIIFSNWYPGGEPVAGRSVVRLMRPHPLGEKYWGTMEDKIYPEIKGFVCEWD